ncbi:phytanoyl-CoA dioxygenase family protein [Beijerinckia indica]|uniref:Phytanoyl-CoA dioxygenase n=1 Tax=Beijerinckia indica subsp. indica (strain ATCC 9039 / DSM 1715 / NCIMB 8712) TaxID=395963 RepID=B2IL01_BEII9|nr:phytanoyl-CoA dioxygenase family protein [Beijerinckia indica]ACB96541.1 Phytanoyl-CoA dioxygenase [Beijerinckia indica subsp. indica ATCC 9039]
MRYDDLAINSLVDTAYENMMSVGYTILPKLIQTEVISQLNETFDPIFETTPFCVGGFYGERTKRFGSLLRRSITTADLIQHPVIIGLAQKILGQWCDNIQLNLGQAIEIHSGALQQFPHRDQDMWRTTPGQEYLINVMWPLSPFHAANGATLIWPHSHGKYAAEGATLCEPIVAECNPTDAIVFLGSTLHGGGSNITASPRRGIIISYCLGWLKPYENQWLVYPPEIARNFPHQLAQLVGYRQHRPNLGNVEGRCPSTLLWQQENDNLAATDALRPDQEMAVADFISSQHAAEKHSIA